jgi:hypothetical protein
MPVIIPTRSRHRHVEGSRLPGLPHRQVSMMLTEEVFVRVRAGAEQAGVTFAAEARRLIENGLKAGAETPEEKADG